MHVLFIVLVLLLSGCVTRTVIVPVQTSTSVPTILCSDGSRGVYFNYQWQCGAGASPLLMAPPQTGYYPSPYSSAPAMQHWLDTQGRPYLYQPGIYFKYRLR
jgi:hypothetical protein